MQVTRLGDQRHSLTLATLEVSPVRPLRHKISYGGDIYLNKACLAFRFSCTRTPESGVLELAVCPSQYSFQGWQYLSTLSFPPQNLSIPSTSYFAYFLQNLMLVEIKKYYPRTILAFLENSSLGLSPAIPSYLRGTNFHTGEWGALGSIAVTRCATRHVQ
ncbi:hypothetical protein EVAR_54592_1 [Eumeta japonica]|uniref:Uncharacterized protein n=1 Tax=Eumeta variegata TaxID=151549 RepID=A0A4C1YJS2_EUMVA|nr:hypothetical protein EVAR_54592_1 [Eumeta japonica]